MDSSTGVTVWAKAQLPGYHRWPDAPTRRMYLRDRHRHLFHITVEVAVDPDARNDRVVEFHDLQDIVRDWWGHDPREWDDASCETIATQLVGLLQEALAYDVVRVEVSEDGESGAVVRP